MWDLIVLACLLQVLGHSDTLTYEPWPTYNEELLVSDTFNLPVQVGFRICCI